MQVKLSNFVYRIALIISFVLLWYSNVLCGTITYQDTKGNWWFKDGDTLFKSIGVVGVKYFGDQPNYEYGANLKANEINQTQWANDTITKMKTWGFNTIGPWSDYILFNKGLYYSENLKIGNNIIDKNSPLRKFPDVFSKKFRDSANSAISSAADRYKNGKLLGFFSDNELDWSIDMLDRYLSLPQNQEGKIAAKNFLKNNNGVITENNRKVFLIQVAEKYFSTIRNAFNMYSANTLFLGCRFSWPQKYNISVVEVSGKYVDVISFQTYPKQFPKKLLEEIFVASWKPILFSEFSVRAKDSGLPNTKGGGLRVENQRERGMWYRGFVCDALAQPYIIGYHWFRWVDEPVSGRFDGENSNHGLVNIKNEPYQEFIDYVKNQNSSCNE
jgi:hypothetical protein